MRATENSVNRPHKQSRRFDLTDRLIIIALLLAEACAVSAKPRRGRRFSGSPAFIIRAFTR
jgi:hypothetical protein